MRVALASFFTITTTTIKPAATTNFAIQIPRSTSTKSPSHTARVTMPPKKAAAALANTKAKVTKRKAEDDDSTMVPARKRQSTRKATATAAGSTNKRRAAAEPAAAPAAKKTTHGRKPATSTATKEPQAEDATTTSNTRKIAPATGAKRARATGPAKKALAKGKVINEPPTQKMNVYVFGEGTAGELGLGTAKNAIDVKRPRLNANLPAETVGVVGIAAGGMHVIALTHDNKILTWGVNDSGALGRDTTWDGGLKDMDAADSDSDVSDDNDNGLNPKESNPGEVDWTGTEVAEGTRWVRVAAGDSCSFALTDDGRVYGWGTFRGNEGVIGFTPNVQTAYRPILITDLKNITAIACGANHALALDTTGAVFAWGAGQQNQLGRRIVERTRLEGLRPRQFGLPKGPKKGMAKIVAGSYHSFAVDKSGQVFSWGLNNYGQTGHAANAGEDDALVMKPAVVKSLQGKNIAEIEGGGHHSLAATEEGDCLVWGRMDSAQVGIAEEEIKTMDDDVVIKDEHGKPRILKVPQKVKVDGKVVKLASASDHNIVITAEGRAASWGFSANYQTGLGTTEDVLVPTIIDNTAVREKRLRYATTGGQFSVVTAFAEEQ